MGKKTTSKGPKAQIEEKPAPKSIFEANWMRSQMTQLRLVKMEKLGVLPPQSEIHRHAPGDENRPRPREGEVVVFGEHVTRGFHPPGSRFFRNVLEEYGLHHRDLAPNLVLNICQFQVFCE